jgi:hypothetical protein
VDRKLDLAAGRRGTFRHQFWLDPARMSERRNDQESKQQ